jgi:hypothetical protein
MTHRSTNWFVQAGSNSPVVMNAVLGLRQLDQDGLADGII